ncbi:mechanosensitive ion channel family protein [Vibrio sp. TH_r3]|uniref:mechanosensitive ion channel family protein n=1 Tax=Vibrio sp. TH_r3 TaxID=3082084 RepID=UPI00295539C0|nr:mechanosensitive ion channel family protein [Vibrio sp. TH_r3]MDV7105833.1 mechanosensitive ion channel family protein [Vibrio sp. TH_r3]
MKLDISFDLEKFTQLIEGKLETWLVEAIKLIPNLIVAIITLIFFIFIANLGGKVFNNLSNKVVDSNQVNNLLSSIVKAAIVAIGFFVALDFIGLQGTVTSLLAGAGILGLAIGFAFQDMTENLISGITMSIRKPFKIGDIIQSNDVMGTIVKINLRNTLVETFSGQHVMIPNKMVFRNILTNYSRKGVRKIEIPVGISYADSPQKAAEVITEALNKKPYIVNKQDTAVYASSFADSSINLLVWFWIEYPGEFGYMDVQHDGIITIHNSLSEAGITIPFPIRTLDFAAKGGKTLSSCLNHSSD